MGNSSSQHDPESEYHDKFDGIETLGYRVLGVQPDSPASKAGLVSFLDFLLGVNGKMLLGSGEGLQEGDEYDDVDLPALLRENLGKELELLVYNIKSQETRLVTLVPSDSWGGAGLLGVTIRLDNYAGADERLIRILSVEHNSPAAIAGLVPEQDYLLGTVGESLEETSSLATLLAVHVDRVVEFYVYNTNSDVVRVVPLMPTWSWGGRGLLGAEVGTGYLHRLPHAVRNTTGSSVARKVRYVRGRHDPDVQVAENDSVTASLEHEPQLELETEEGGRPGTMASPEDVSDMTATNKNVAFATRRINNNNVSVTAMDTTFDSMAEKRILSMENASPIVQGAQQVGGRSETSKPIDAAALFSGPPPGDAMVEKGDDGNDKNVNTR